MPNATCKKNNSKNIDSLCDKQMNQEKIKIFFFLSKLWKINNKKIIRDRSLLIDQSNDSNFLTSKKNQKSKKAAAAVRPYDFFYV